MWTESVVVLNPYESVGEQNKNNKERKRDALCVRIWKKLMKNFHNVEDDWA